MLPAVLLALVADFLLKYLTLVAYLLLIVWAVLLAVGAVLVTLMKVRESTPVNFPKVSVLVAVWNEARSISSCIESIIESDYPRDRVDVVVVGGGTDGTVSVCETYAQKGLISFIPSEQRMGKWFDLNKGLQSCRGDVIAFTDSDCRVDKHWLSRLVATITSGCDGVIGLVLPSKNSSYISKGFHVILPGIGVGAYLVSKIAVPPFSSGYSSAFRRTVFDKLQFEPSLIEDVVFTRKARTMFKLKLNPICNTFHNFGANTTEFYKEVERWVGGYATELKRSQSLTLSLVAATLFLLPFVSVVGLIDLVSGDRLLFMLLGLMVLAGFCYGMVSVWRIGRPGWVVYFPHAVVLTAMLGLMSLAVTLSMLAGKNIEWRLTKKSGPVV